ncbi:hypothetical protein BWI17_12545 [Betaproteobacteria bacterium GR16-43]|nr:hypothetical protein BWI17_12545 [Betaproteobacteria bacterium GR16-43]
MKRILFALAALLAANTYAADPEHVKSVEAWRARVEKSLRADNGWLTLAGRFPMKQGANTFGTGEKNDLVFPKGLGAERIGTIFVEPGKVTMKLEPGVEMTKEGLPFTERTMGTDSDKRDWVQMGRASMHVIEREGRYILRLADNDSKVRSGFESRVWYGVNDAYYVDAKFIPYPKGKTVPIINVLDESSDEPSPGYVQFKLGGKVQKLDVVGDDEGLFIIFRDTTAGKGTYKPGRFLYVEKKPEPNKTFKLDLNRAYNPPCAFSEFTTCPLPPEQNILKVKVEAGEKYPPKRAG